MASYFFVGIGGSGMLPLAMILRGRGAAVAGSDRAFDQGRTPDKFAALEGVGIRLFPQDGSGIAGPDQIVVASAAIENTVLDIAKAEEVGAPRMTRAELLADLFNAAPLGIAVGGTSGKSTTTGMIGWILHACGRDPTVMNGAAMKNFENSSALVGGGDAFVSEVDESDGSIALYAPTVGVLTNVTLDHKPMDELRPLFGHFLGRSRFAVLNADDGEAVALAPEGDIAFGIESADCELRARNIIEEPTSVRFDVESFDKRMAADIRLGVPGRHNVYNALAALAAVTSIGIELADAAAAISGFAGLKRRFEIVGEAGATTVIDDFAHNPDKIAATLNTLHTFPGRLLIYFQPHGFGPLKILRAALADCFVDHLRGEDLLLLSDPAYFGGTVDRSVGSGDLVADIFARGRQALHIPARVDCGLKLAELARPGDRIIVMGARDDTLSEFAVDILARIAHRAS